MRKLTSCVGYAKRMAARMQFNAVKDQLNMVLVALAGETRAKVNVPNRPGSRCNVSNQSVQTEANIITEKEYTALMSAVVEKAEQCQEEAQSLIRRARRCHCTAALRGSLVTSAVGSAGVTVLSNHMSN